MLMIIKAVSGISMIPLKFQVTDFKLVSWTARHGAPQKKGDPKNEGKSLDVVENTCRKNVSFWPCVEVNENKCTYSFPQNMLMKNKGVIENEAGVARPASPQFVPRVQGIAANFHRRGVSVVTAGGEVSRGGRAVKKRC
jgi:hypothetical protein